MSAKTFIYAKPKDGEKMGGMLMSQLEDADVEKAISLLFSKFDHEELKVVRTEWRKKSRK